VVWRDLCRWPSGCSWQVCRTACHRRLSRKDVL